MRRRLGPSGPLEMAWVEVYFSAENSIIFHRKAKGANIALVHAEPVAILGHPQLQLAGRDRTDPQLASLRPFDGDRAGIGLQLQQQFQATIEILDDDLVHVGAAAPRKVTRPAITQGRAGLDQGGVFGQFARQIPSARRCWPPMLASRERPPSPAT